MRPLFFCLTLVGLWACDCTNKTFESERNVSDPFAAEAVSTVDTLLSREDHQLYFKVTTGEGIPILLESGAGNDGAIWDTIIDDLHWLTGAPIIQYDRAGFGQSTLDTVHKDLQYHGLYAGLDDLEFGLQQIGFSDGLFHVSHSYGGYFSYLLSHHHPDRVKGIVAIDIVHDFHTDGHAEVVLEEMAAEIAEWETSEPEMYYLMKTLPEAARIVDTLKIPSYIPVWDITPKAAENTNAEGANRWEECHQKFVEGHQKAQRIEVDSAGHYVWLDRPSYTTSLIAMAYQDHLQGAPKTAVAKRLALYLAKENLTNNGGQ